jgi:hypothetical protein
LGYTTDFEGAFTITPTLKPTHKKYINAFSETRRMKRNADEAMLIDDPLRKVVGLPIGVQGEYFVGSEANIRDMGQIEDNSVINYNSPPETQPGLWCQWITTDDGTALMWNGGEKFYYYTEWLKYLIDNFFSKWGYSLTGEVTWQGEECDDIGKIVVKDNTVRIFYGTNGMKSSKMKERADELEYLRWFAQNADFGPADSNIRDDMNNRFMKKTGKLLPLGWNYNSEGVKLE